MNSSCCCEMRETARKSGLARWLAKALGSAVPAASALLLPKCPVCLVAWMAASTGFAIPAAIASSVVPLLVTAGLFSAYLWIRRWHK